MDYKDTLNLPSTSFPMRAKLPQREPELLKRWQEEGLWQQMRQLREGSTPFLFHDGPPYANGNIHAGHVLNKVLKDIVVKYRHLAGFRVSFRPGWDCHGLPIELEVEKKLGRKKRADTSRVEVRQLCRDYALDCVDRQREDFKRLGIQADWDNPYLTLDKAYEADELRELAHLADSGALYHGRRPVHWCSSCRTALAEAEVEYSDHSSRSVYVRFAFAGATGDLQALVEEGLGVAIWTTTPWTLPANLAICVNPGFDYVVVDAPGGPLLVAEGMLEQLREVLGLGATRATIAGRELEGMTARHPWLDRDSLLVLGDHVTLEAGTGCVHTAPGHGHDDYVVGRRYGLEVYAPVDAAGCFTSELPELEGKHVFSVDDTVVEILQAAGALLAEETIQHSYPHCWRCRRPIIFRATDQWFVSMDSIRERALECVDEVKWIPSWGRDRIHGMIAGRPDWCLSRQRAWGVPVPALHCTDCGQATCDGDVVRHVADLFEEEGSDAWFTRDIEDLLPAGFACPSCSGTNFERDNDILDVWFDSGSSFSSVMERDHGEGTVSDLYLEGSDQHRGWFHSSLLTSVATRDRAPYRAVLTHGFLLDGKGRKQSKSLGNVVEPAKVLKQYGADIMRLWVSSEDYRDDVSLSDEILKRVSDSYRRIRNTARNLLGNLHDFDPVADAVAWDDMDDLDRWVLAELHGFVDRCRGAYEGCEFHVVYRELNNFCSVELSSQYFDIVKDRLYCGGRDSRERRSAQTAMRSVLETLTVLVAPVLSFTAEEIWGQIPGNDDAASVFMQDFPVPDENWNNEMLLMRWQATWTARAAVTRALEEKRQAGDIGHSLDASVVLAVPSADFELLEQVGEETLAAVIIVSQLELIRSDGDDTRVEVAAARGGKCARCWNYDELVDEGDDTKLLCGRCGDVVASIG
ncbi:MAG TPA: isoleucine--tRNA ligase [Deltaproteobacteria bacterium]|nr:isoleucine--tRNA ligase [Candidatus Binatota bacterium]HIL12092.1 isoleucine--tRNA ligase [Deltaproteobacteria bacterium]